MKKRTKRIVAGLLAFAIILQQNSMAGMTLEGLATDEIIQEELQEPEILEEPLADASAESPADLATEDAEYSTADASAEEAAEAPADGSMENSEEPQLTVTEIVPVDQAEEAFPEEESSLPAEEPMLPVLRLDNCAQTAEDAQASPVTLELTRPDGFPKDASHKMETLKVEETAGLTAETEGNLAGGLALRFSVELDGNACDLSGTTAVLDGLDASYLTGGHLSLCRDADENGASAEDKWEELAVQFSQNGGAVRSSFSVDSDGILLFWKDAEAGEEVAEAVESETIEAEATEEEQDAESETTELETMVSEPVETEEETADVDEIGQGSEVEQETEAATEAEKMEAETAEAEQDAETEIGMEAGTEAEVETETETGTEQDTELGTEAETEIMFGAESAENEGETESEVATEAESETETETETEELAYDLADLSSDGLMQIGADEIDETKTFYEVFYKATGKLVFQKDEPTESEEYVIYADSGSNAKNSESDWPFHGVRSQIQSVEFLDDVPMTSMAYIFSNCKDLADVKTDKFTAKDVVSLGYAFEKCSKLKSLDLSNWNTSSVTYMSFMFEGCSGLTELNVRTWNTSSVTQFQRTFRDCTELKSLDVHMWDTSSADNLQQVFYGCGGLTALDLSNWDANKASSLNQLFNRCDALSQLTLGPNFKFKGGTSLNGTWIRKTTEELYSAKDLEEKYNAEMADTYYKLTPIYFHANDGTNNKSTLENGYIGKTLEDTDVTTPVRAGYEFAGWWPKADSDEGGQLKVGDTITQTDYYAHWKEYKVYEIFYKENGELVFQDTDEVDLTKVDPEETDKYEIYEDDGRNALASGASNASWAFHGIRSQIKYVEFRDNVKLKTLQHIFNGCDQLLTVDTQKYNAAGIKSLSYAFNNCTSLTKLNLNNWDVSSVTDMGHVFEKCKGLQSLEISNWTTSSVTSVYSAFRDCILLETLDVGSWDTSNVDNMMDVFYECEKLKELDISNWTAGSRPSRMFYNCFDLYQLKLNAAFVTSQETNLKGQWKGLVSQEEYDAKSLMTSADKASDTYVRAVPITFHGNGGNPDQTKVDGFVGFALGEDKWNTLTEPTYAGYVFGGWWTAPEDGEQLTAETLLTQTDYYAHWKKDRVYEILYESGELVFQSDNTPDPDKGEVRQIFEDDGSNAGSDKWEFDEMRDLITSVSFRDNVKLKSLQAIFKDCRNLSAVDVGSYDAIGVTTIAYAFSGCESLTSLNLNAWNVSSVTYIGYAFQNCKNLRSLEIDKWNTGNVWNMYNTFNGCSSLEKLDVSAWDTAKVSNMIGTFGSCSSLTELDLNGWNTKSVTAESNMANLFAGCTSLYQLSLGVDFRFFKNAGLDGQWRRGDAGEVYSGAELMSKYNGTTMADTYHRYVRVSFNGNGGIASPQSIECYLGETVDALPTAEWEGYHFLGWFTERNSGELLGENGSLTQAIYYAHWDPYKYTLRLNALNGDKDHDIEDIPLTFDEFYQLSENKFTYEGKFLLGWNTKRDGSGEMYGPNSRVSGLADQDGSTVNLYAIWGDPDDYVTLTFDSGFDSADEGAEVPSMRFKKGETVEAKHLPQSTREGYRFEGWSYEEAGEPISDKDRVEMSEDRTLYAIWKEYLTVTFDPKKEGLAPVKAQAVADEPLEGSLPDFPQREDGSILIGWFTGEKDGTQVKAGETSVATDTTFYAHWGWRPQFDTAGGKFTTTPEIPFAESSNYTLGALPEVTRDGYTFDAWYYVDGTEAERQVSEGEVVELGKNTRIVAHWTPVQKVKVTLDPGEGTIDGKDGERILNAYQGKAIGDLPVPKREGYIFLGWYDESNTLCNLDSEFETNKTLTAQWAKEVTVTFMDGGKQVATLTVPEGGTIPSLPGVNVDPKDTTRNDKILEGWYTEENGAGTKLTTGTTISKNVTYYAKWKDFKQNGDAGATPYTYGIEWNSASNENVDNVDGHLVFHPTDYRSQTAQLHVHFWLNVGTQGSNSSIPKGGVKIKIPKYVWKDWDKKWIGTSNVEASLKKATGGAKFAISEEESTVDYYVLVNTEDITGGAGMDATFSYNVDPNQVPGGGLDAAGNYVTNGVNYYHETFQVTITVDVDPKDSEIETHTEELSIEMHTRVRTFASKEFVKMYPSYSNSWKDTWGPKPADADDYFYIEWKLKETSESTTNQPFDFTWSEENTVHDGTVVGYLNNEKDKTHVNATGHEIFDKQRVLVKYPRTMLSEATDGKLLIHNEAIVTENWQSGYETSHRVSADYTLKVPKYSGGGRGLDKISFDVANSRNISRPAQKHGGQEDILIDENEVSLGWRVNYSGGAKEEPKWNSDTETYTRSDRTISITDGLEKSLLYSSGSSADDKYLWNPSTGNVELSDEDYRFTSVKVNLKEYDMVSYSDAWSEMAEHENIADYEDVYLFVRYKDSDTPVFFARVGINVPVSLPENVCGIEIRHDSSFYWTDITVDLGVNLRPSPAVSRLFKEDVGREATSIVKNWARCRVWANDSRTEPYVNAISKNEGSADKEVWEMDISDTSQFLQKTATTYDANVILDVKHGTQDSPMCLAGWLYNNGGRTPRMQTGVFYDLLPLGTTVDPETVYGIWTDTNWSSVAAPGHPANNYKSNQNSARRLPSACVDVKFESNWQGSQRTMMIIEFALPEGVKANGVQIFYLLRTTYENIMENGATQQNSAAFVNTTELSATPKLTQSGISILNQDEKYFKSLDTEYSGRISYSEDSENYIPVDVSTWGFDKQVKAETGSSYVQKDNVLQNDTYTYRLIYSQGSGTYTKGIVFLDVLENGYYEKDPTSESGKKLIEAEWQGTFENINVESIRKLTMMKDDKTLHCNPVVYYSTTKREDIDTTNLNLLDPQVWKTDLPDNKKDITAVAVDCSMCKEEAETPFELKGNVDAMEIYITMRAPINSELSDKTTRNRAVLNMTHVDSERSETAVMMDAGASVVLKDVTPELHKSSDPGSGTDTNPAPVYKDDQLTYTLSVKNTGEEAWLDDIVLEDTIPEGLSVQKSNIRVRFGADAFTAIEGVPRVKLSRTGRKLTFRIGMLYPGETVEIEITGTVTATTGTLENTAYIVSVNDVEKTVTSETTYHKVTPIGFNISKTGVGGRPLAGAILQLWRLKDDAEVGAELNTDNYTMVGEEWVSDGKVKTFTGQSKGIYVLHEVSAPPGHLRAEDITMELDSRGNLTLDGKPVPSVTMKDDYTKVSIVKEDHTGHAVKGAKLAIYDLDSFDTMTGEPISGKTPVAEWETDGSPHELDGVLKAGEKYILYETEAPEGYRRAEPVEFEVPSDGSHYTVLMTDPLDSFEVKIRKVDPDGNPLAGAKLRITGKKKEEKTEISPIEWDTTVEDYTVKLYPGEYKLSEVYAPDGYAVAEPIEFKVEEDTTNNAQVTVNEERVKDLTLVMEDKWAQDLTVTKTVKGEELEDSGEKKEYSFTLTLKKADGSPYTERLAYKKRVKSTEGKPDTVTSGMISSTGNVYQFYLAGDESFTFVDVPQGLTYEVDEISEAGAGYVVTKENDTGTTNGFEATAVNITNTYPAMGDLLISKTVIGSWAPSGEMYTVQITTETGKAIYDGSSSSDIQVYKMSSDGKAKVEDAEITQEHIIVKLAGGEQIVVSGLKPGTYTVTETGADSGSGAVTFTKKYKVNGGDESDTADVEIAGNTIGNVEVRNTYTDVGELTIEKTVSGGPEPDDDIWYTVQVSTTTSGAFENYQIQCEPKNSYQNAKRIKGGLQFQLLKGSKVTISGLPVGTYTVKESLIGLDCIPSYKVTVNGTSKTSEADGSVTLSRGTGTSMVSSGTVQIDNRYPESTSMTLTGTKAVIGKNLEANKYEFTLRALTNPENGAELPTSTTVRNSGDSDGRFSFDEITFTKVGTYVFEVSETGSDDPGVGTDGTVYTVTVMVDLKKDSENYAYEIRRVLIERTAAGSVMAEQVALYEKVYSEESEDSGFGDSGGSEGEPDVGDTVIPSNLELPPRTDEGKSATFINRVKDPLEMPDTGGPGAAPLTRTSILLCLAGCFILLLAKRRKPRGSG